MSDAPAPPRNHAEEIADLRFAMEQEKRDRERQERLRRQFDEEDGA